MPPATCLCHLPPGGVELRSFNLPEPEAGQVIVENLFSGISPGTESRCLRGQQAGGGDQPYVPGYQAVGRILAVGPEVAREPGEMVFHMGGNGFGPDLAPMWGGHASHVLLAESQLFVLPAGISPSLAAVGKLAAIAYHGLEAGAVREGERVGLVGLGVLGQLSARLAKLRGAEVVAFDRVASRVEAARQAGVEAIVVEGDLASAARASGWPERSFDVLLDVTGYAGLLDEVVGLARDLLPWDAPVDTPTRTIIQGSYAGNAVFDYQAAFLKQMTFIIPRDNTRRDVEAVLPLLSSPALGIAELTGPPVSPREAPELYRELGAPGADRLTAVFDWSQL